MPHATLLVGLGYTEEAKQKLAEKVAADICETLGVEPMWVSVVIEEVPFEAWEERVEKAEIAEKNEMLYITPGYLKNKS